MRGCARYAQVVADPRRDLIAMPTFATLTRNTSPASLTGAPSLSAPAGLDAQGLQVGLMIESPPGTDRRLLAAGRMVESIARSS